VTFVPLVRTLTFLLLAAQATVLHAAPRWRMQYFYDEYKSTLAIVDLQFPSATRGIAVGVIEDGRRQKPAAVLTSDGGAHWQMAELPGIPVSLFFLNEGIGWLVTDKSDIWQTTEAGRNWKRIAKMSGHILRVYFNSETHGWALGDKKRVLETSDGGLHWTPVPAAAEPPGKAEVSSYNWMVFANSNVGMISGYNLPPRNSPERPDWLDPQASMRRTITPHLTYMLMTDDAGKTWRAGSGSLLGEVSRIRMRTDGSGLGLIEYDNSFRYPSEMYQIDLKAGTSKSVYRNQNFHVTDIWFTPEGPTLIAGVAVTGQMRNLVPGKVRVMSGDLKTWEPMDVDYRAVATRVVLAGAGGSLWMATDTGMILKLSAE